MYIYVNIYIHTYTYINVLLWVYHQFYMYEIMLLCVYGRWATMRDWDVARPCRTNYVVSIQRLRVCFVFVFPKTGLVKIVGTEARNTKTEICQNCGR